MKKAITISGGFDSGVLPFLLSPVEIPAWDFIFFDYGQLYMEKEKRAATDLAHYFGKDLRIWDIGNMTTDHPRRNFIFLSELKKLRYEKVMMGTRNPVPLFDKYRDSNFLSLKIVAFMFDISLTLPLIGWNKKRIIQFLLNQEYLYFYNCYKNNDSIYTCDCPNCKELRKIILFQ